MTIETAKMSERGQIIIPKEIRQAVQAVTNSIFAVSALSKDTIIMKKLDTTSLLEEFKSLRKQTKKFSAKEIEEEIHAYRKDRS